ncbi:iron ABC transporter ATP-binding protein [Acuticoccus yangtzensis]|uniref:iron ABC transporter ATP-binding protein n=1 Tax=Acuticoccus yangtzensis TaxID=1443441 RepID=UPI0009496F7A|nr:ATP-binding cassette domain-containing protein [Acuticoccus yangtzensis]
MIEIEAVSCSIRGASILSDVSLSLGAGGVTALVGPNGAGKSTLLSMMARLRRPDRGTITVAGHDVAATRPRVLARHLAVMPQDAALPGRLTVAELVGFGRFPHHRGRPGPADRVAVEEAITAFGLVGFEGRFLETLSGGQRQLARAAMAFAQGTPVVLLDEPLNNLDIVHARQLMARLRLMADEAGRTVVVVLHDINHAGAWADRIVAMRGGRIVAAAPTDEVMDEAVLERVYGVPVRIASADGERIALHFR